MINYSRRTALGKNITEKLKGKNAQDLVNRQHLSQKHRIKRHIRPYDRCFFRFWQHIRER